MANSGYKGFTSLELYYTDNGASTGTTKANTGSDYIAPVYDITTCPVGTIYNSAVVSGLVQKNNCTGGAIGSWVTVTIDAGTFTSTVDQPTANALAQAYFDTNKQAIANEDGTCKLYHILTVGKTIMAGYGYKLDIIGAEYVYTNLAGEQIYNIYDGANLSVQLSVTEIAEGETNIHGQVTIQPYYVQADTYQLNNIIGYTWQYTIGDGDVYADIIIDNNTEF